MRQAIQILHLPLNGSSLSSMGIHAMLHTGQLAFGQVRAQQPIDDNEKRKSKA
jgi:hypothetical protein